MAFVVDDQSMPCSLKRREFEILTRQHVDGMWRTAYRMTGCKDVAADLTQETCLKAFCSFEHYRPDSNYQAWIYRILTNLCRDYLRREARAPFRLWDNDEVDAAMSKCSETGVCQPDTHLQVSHFYEQAIEAMTKLEPELRMVVCLSMLEGLSYQEMAEVTDVPVGTIRSRLSRGRKLMQQALRSHLQPEETERSMSLS